MTALEGSKERMNVDDGHNARLGRSSFSRDIKPDMGYLLKQISHSFSHSLSL